MIKLDNMNQQIDPITGLPITTNVGAPGSTPIPGAVPHSLPQEGVQAGGRTLTSDPMYQPPLMKLDPMYNGKPGVQKEDFKQFKK